MEFSREMLVKWIKKYQYVLLVLVAGVLLLMLPGAAPKEQEIAQTQTDTAAVFDLSAFEEQLGEALSAVEGVGKAQVVLTLSSGGRRLLAENEKQSADSRETTTVILSQGSSQQSAVTVEMLYPSFQGALVVCDGGNSPSVRLAVVHAVAALTGLDAGNISVCARTGGSSQ